METIAFAFLVLILILVLIAVVDAFRPAPSYRLPTAPLIVIHSLANRAGVRLDGAGVPYLVRLARLRALAKRYPNAELVSEWARKLGLNHLAHPTPAARYIRDLYRAR